MQNHDQCPFCGGDPIKKNPYSDRVKKAGIGIGVLDVSGSGDVEMNENPQKIPAIRGFDFLVLFKTF